MRRTIISSLLAIILAACSGGGTTAVAPVTTAVAQTAPTIGFIGCSNTWMSVAGYHMVAGNKNRLWPQYATGGGSVDKWASASSNYWTLYRQQVAKFGQPQKVWVQLCENYQASPASYAMVQQMLANLKAISPNATPYISAINIYNPFAGLCALMGPAGQGETDTVNWAAQAVAAGLGVAGPAMGPLDVSLLQPDHCHPTNPTGAVFLGGQLVGAFDQ